MHRLTSSIVVVVASALVVGALGWSLLGDIGVSLLVGVNDDAGYYLRIARNEFLGHGGTFDWIHPTNGFNPLLKSLYTTAFALVDPRDRDRCYRIGIGLTFVFAVLSLVLFASLMRRVLAWLELESFPIRLLHGLSCFFLAWMLLKEYYGLDAFPVLFFQLALVRVHVAAWRRDSWLRYGALGVLALLANLSRLDSLSFSAAFAFYYALLAAAGRLRARNVLAFALPVALGVCAFMAWNHREFGVLLPVSAKLKNSFPHPDVVTAFRTIVFTSSRLPNTLVFYASLGAGLVYSISSLPRVLELSRGRPIDRWWDLVFPLSIYALGHTLYFSLFGRFDFQGTYMVFLSVYLLLLVVHALRQGEPTRRFDRRRAAAGAGAVLLGAAVCVLGIRVARLAQLASEHRLDERAVGHEIERLTGPDDVIFGEHYGLVSFFTDRAFINGDGVVNAVTYAPHRTARGAQLSAYLGREGVTCVFGNPDAREFAAWDAACTIVGEWANASTGHVALCRRGAAGSSR